MLLLSHCLLFRGMTLILLVAALVDARLGDRQHQHDSTRFSSLQTATLVRGAAPPAEHVVWQCTIDEHCVGRNEQCVAGSCDCLSGYQRLATTPSDEHDDDERHHCTRIDQDLLANA